MNALDVQLRLDTLHCFDEGDGIGSAEPYLWTVFFKIDGNTTQVSTAFKLQGTATVVGTPGNHGNLPNHDVDPGETIAIPGSLGAFNTRLKPIALQQPVGNVTAVGGVMGLVAVLMEEDSTPNSAIAKGHAALDLAVRKCLNELIPTLGIAHQEPTPAEIEAMKKKIGDAVTAAVKNDVSAWEWISGLGNMDDRIGAEVFRFSHTELDAAAPNTLNFSKRFKSEGDWELKGHVKATRVPLVLNPGVLTPGVLTGVVAASAAPRAA